MVSSREEGVVDAEALNWASRVGSKTQYLYPCLVVRDHEILVLADLKTGTLRCLPLAFLYKNRTSKGDSAGAATTGVSPIWKVFLSV